MGEHVPRAAGAGLVEQGVEDLAEVDRARSPARRGRGDERLQQGPLIIGEVRRIRLAHRDHAGGFGRVATP